MLYGEWPHFPKKIWWVSPCSFLINISFKIYFSPTFFLTSILRQTVFRLTYLRQDILLPFFPFTYSSYQQIPQPSTQVFNPNQEMTLGFSFLHPPFPQQLAWQFCLQNMLFIYPLPLSVSYYPCLYHWYFCPRLLASLNLLVY